MRKRTINNLWDSIFWGIIYLLPLLLYFVDIIALKGEFTTTLQSFMVDFVDSNNIILELFNQFLGGSQLTVDGSTIDMYFFGNYSPVVYYLAYCATVAISHVFFDIVVFIPRLAHKWLGKATQQD